MGRFSVFTKNCLMDFFVFIMDVVNDLGGGWAITILSPGLTGATSLKLVLHLDSLCCTSASCAAHLQLVLQPCSYCYNLAASIATLQPVLQLWHWCCIFAPDAACPRLIIYPCSCICVAAVASLWLLLLFNDWCYISAVSGPFLHPVLHFRSHWLWFISSVSATSQQSVLHLRNWYCISTFGARSLQLVLHLCSWCRISAAGAASLQLALHLCS